MSVRFVEIGVAFTAKSSRIAACSLRLIELATVAINAQTRGIETEIDEDLIGLAVEGSGDVEGRNESKITSFLLLEYAGDTLAASPP